MSACRVVVLGTDHSVQLAVRAYEPAVFRAFFHRVNPGGVCVETPPAEFARGAWPESTDRRRLDSYFDPFGNLTVRQRALLEAAREYYKQGAGAGGDAIRQTLTGELSDRQTAQLAAYWAPYVQRLP